MKYTIQEIFDMEQKDIEAHCDGRCESPDCLFKPSLRKVRVDGYCIKETYNLIDYWIGEEEAEIRMLEHDIQLCKKRIREYKSMKKKIEGELNKCNTHS